MADLNAEDFNIDSLIEDAKNKLTIFCTRCPSKILCKGVGKYKEIEYRLPKACLKKVSSDDKDEEELKHYWMIDNMYHFENIGYSNTVDGRKYLVCADCEMGPIGWQDLKTKASYLAVRRVKYSD